MYTDDEMQILERAISKWNQPPIPGMEPSFVRVKLDLQLTTLTDWGTMFYEVFDAQTTKAIAAAGLVGINIRQLTEVPTQRLVMAPILAAVRRMGPF